MPSLARDILFGKEWYEKRDAGVEKAYQLAKAAYGPSAGNVGIELNYGFPLSSRDGVTNLRNLHLPDPHENNAARIIVQASEKSNKVVGDGTSLVAVLSYHLYKEAVKLIGAGHNRMAVKRKIEQIANQVIDAIDKIKIKTTPDLSRFVAKVSASDEAVGDMVADVIDRVGIEGNIIVEEFDGIGSYDEEVNGFYFRKGFTNEFLINNISALESRMNDVDILITEKPLKTAADIGPILSKIVEAGVRGAEVLIIGDVSDEALTTLALNKVRGNINTTLVDVPVYGPMRSLFLDDIACYTGGQVFPTGAKATSFMVDMLGSAKKVVVNSYSTTIIDGEGAVEDMRMRISDLRKQLKEAESLIDKEEIKKRLATLTGKISIIRVGAPTEIDRGETQLRVEDAIAATQSAIRDGIVPGGGVCLARIAPDELKDAFTAPFETLVENAGLNPKEALYKALDNDHIWAGYNLKAEVLTSEPVNLLKVGVIDPAEVIKTAVRNAASVVGTLIAMEASIVYKNREQVAQ